MNRRFVLQDNCATPEEWRDIPNYPGYQVSNAGNVRSYRAKRNALPVPYPIKPSIIRGRKNVGLWLSGKKHHLPIHRLVLLAFVGPPSKEKPCCCHIDGDPDNNIPENLKWGSYKDNAEDRDRHSRTAIGEGNAAHRFITEDILQIRDAYFSGVSIPKLANYFKASTSTIGAIVTGQSWKNVGGPISEGVGAGSQSHNKPLSSTFQTKQ
jgi:hypothetical protein